MNTATLAKLATLTGCTHPCPWTCYGRLAALAVVVAVLGAPGLSPALLSLRPGPEEVYLLLAATGLFTGLLSGMLGIGGALVVVPVLYVLLPLTGFAVAEVPKVAVASSLVAMVPTALMAAWAQYRRGGLDTATLRAMAPGMTAGAAVGAGLALVVCGPVLALLFAAQSLYYGASLVRPSRARVHGAWHAWTVNLVRRCPVVIVGPVAAGLSSCAGMGAGCLVVPYLRTRGLSLHVATATSGALNLGVAIGGAVLFAFTSAATGSASPAWPAALLLGSCSVLAVSAGVELGHWVPLRTLEKVLGGVTLLGAVVLLVRMMVA
jgi:uncharacterized membrane protein YfcA